MSSQEKGSQKRVSAPEERALTDDVGEASIDDARLEGDDDRAHEE